MYCYLCYVNYTFEIKWTRNIERGFDCNRNVLTTDTEPLKLSTRFIGATFTSSNFQPYITHIKLYQENDYDTPAIQATLPRPIRKSKKIATTFKIKLDM